MSRQAVILVKCDLCGDTYDEDAVPNVRIILGGTEFEVDVCDRCVETYSFQAVLGEMRPVKSASPTKPSKKTVPAPEPEFPCEYCDRSFYSQRGLSKHMNAMH